MIGICFLIFFISFAFLAIVPTDFSPSLEHKELRESQSISRPREERLNSIKQEINKRLKVPLGIVFKNESYHGSLIHNEINKERDAGLIDDGADGEVKQQNLTTSADSKEKTVRTPEIARTGLSRDRLVLNERKSVMEDQVIMAKTYLQYSPANSNSHLVRELKLRIKEIQRVLSNTKGTNLRRAALQKMRAMEDTLSKARKEFPDCSAMASKLRAMNHNTEEQLRAETNQASYLIQLAASTFPKGLHCLSMRLTTQYFSLEAEDRPLPYDKKVQRQDLYHYAIFSDNVLACAVVVNSTVSTSKAKSKVVFHIVTDSLNLPAITMWFHMNPPGEATIHIQNIDEFKWLPPDFSAMIKKSGVKDPRFSSPLNHLRFYLPDIFPYLNKILLLDHDVVVQKDLRELWKINMKGKVIGVVETCEKDGSFNTLDTLVDFSERSIEEEFDAKACLWAFGMNIFDLQQWRRLGLTHVYNKWLQLGKTMTSWKAGSLPLGQLTFYKHTLPLNRKWQLLGLGQDTRIETAEINRAAALHYSGSMKPWLEIAVPRFRGYWNKFLKYDQPYLRQCNIHE